MSFFDDDDIQTVDSLEDVFPLGWQVCTLDHSILTPWGKMDFRLRAAKSKDGSSSVSFTKHSGDLSLNDLYGKLAVPSFHREIVSLGVAFKPTKISKLQDQNRPGKGWVIFEWSGNAAEHRRRAEQISALKADAVFSPNSWD